MSGKSGQDQVEAFIPKAPIDYINAFSTHIVETSSVDDSREKAEKIRKHLMSDPELAILLGAVVEQTAENDIRLYLITPIREFIDSIKSKDKISIKENILWIECLIEIARNILASPIQRKIKQRIITVFYLVCYIYLENDQLLSDELLINLEQNVIEIEKLQSILETFVKRLNLIKTIEDIKKGKPRYIGKIKDSEMVLAKENQKELNEAEIIKQFHVDRARGPLIQCGDLYAIPKVGDYANYPNPNLILSLLTQGDIDILRRPETKFINQLIEHGIKLTKTAHVDYATPMTGDICEIVSATQFSAVSSIDVDEENKDLSMHKSKNKEDPLVLFTTISIKNGEIIKCSLSIKKNDKLLTVEV